MEPMTMMALASAAAPLLGGLFGGGGDKLKKIKNFDPGQQRFFDQYKQQALESQGGMQDVMGLLQSMLDPNSDFFQNFENQQMNQFNEQTLPNIAERFAGAGALSSSGFGQALGGAASGLQSNLAAGKSSMIMQALQQLMQQYNQQAQTVLGAKPFDYINKQGGGGFGGGLAQGASNIPWGDVMKMFSGYDTMFRQQGVY
jgi:hypothetical protein